MDSSSRQADKVRDCPRSLLQAAQIGGYGHMKSSAKISSGKGRYTAQGMKVREFICEVAVA